MTALIHSALASPGQYRIGFLSNSAVIGKRSLSRILLANSKPINFNSVFTACAAFAVAYLKAELNESCSTKYYRRRVIRSW